jgi:hypothetical protein
MIEEVVIAVLISVFVKTYDCENVLDVIWVRHRGNVTHCSEKRPGNARRALSTHSFLVDRRTVLLRVMDQPVPYFGVCTLDLICRNKPPNGIEQDVGTPAEYPFESSFPLR